MDGNPIATRHSGFTLLEILVSLAIMTVVIGALVSAHLTIADSQEKFRESVQGSYHLSALESRHHRGGTVSNRPAMNSGEWAVEVSPEERMDVEGSSVLLRVDVSRGKTPRVLPRVYLSVPTDE